MVIFICLYIPNYIHNWLPRLYQNNTHIQGNTPVMYNPFYQLVVPPRNNAIPTHSYTPLRPPRYPPLIPSYSPRLRRNQIDTEKIRQHIIQQIRAPPPRVAATLPDKFPAPSHSSSDLLSQRTEKRSRFLNADDDRVSPTKRKKPSVATAIGCSSNSSQTELQTSRTPGTFADLDGNQLITQPIMEYFETNKQSESVYEEKLRFRQNIYKILLSIFPYCGLYIVGSSITGFSMTNSDMDLCLMLTFNKVDQRKEAVSILFLIQKTLRQSSFISSANVIKARVPILKIKSKSGIESDVNINNSVGIRNTHLLKHYALIDERVRPLVLFVKRWSKFHNINDASKMTISSYSLTLMVISYLQCGCTPPVLPCLQDDFPAKFNGSIDVRDLRPNENIEKYTSLNRETVGDLFLGFLKYYATQFNYEEDVICVRTGSLRSIYDVKNTSTEQRDWKFLNIEEPFDRSNTARSVFDKYTFERIRRVFRQSYQTLARHRNPSYLLKCPF